MKQDDWEIIFENQISLLKELSIQVKKRDSRLKFNLPYLKVSDISSQFYSEAKLELDYIFGKAKTEEQREGTLLHEKMSEGSVKVKFKDLIKNIQQAQEIWVVESLFLMKFQDKIIVGIPDLIIFKKGLPIYLFEYKFSKYSTTFPNQHVQAQVYCQIIKEMGYNTDLLYYGIILAPRNLSKMSKKIKTIPQKIVSLIDFNSLIQKQEYLLQFDQIRVFLYKFDTLKVKKDLEWAIDYWEGKRKIGIQDLLHECMRHEYKERCKITYSIVEDLNKKFKDNIICIYGIGSFFDRKLPDDWIKLDVDIICVVKKIEKIPKTQDWTKVRKLDYKKGKYMANVFFNSLEGLKHKEIFEKESWANYKWALLDFKMPNNSVILYGNTIFDQLPEVDSLAYDYKDLLRHSFYNLNYSLAIKDEKASMNKFTKGVFKFAFLICVSFDPSFKYTSIIEITIKIKELVKDQKIDTSLYNLLLLCENYRRGILFSEEFSSLRDNFIISCIYQLYEGKLWKKFEWEEIIQFCHITYNGLYALEKVVKREKDLFYSTHKKE